MNNLNRLQERLSESEFTGFVIPSTDEYLSEFARPCCRRLQWTTRFRGSTGTAIVLRDRAALFVDSRYRSQAEQDTCGLGIEVLAADETARQQWLCANFEAGQLLAVDPRLHSYVELERLLRYCGDYDFRVITLERNLIDDLWASDRPGGSESIVVDYPTFFAGASAEQKCQQLQNRLSARRTHWHLIADPEDAAWLLNARTEGDLCEGDDDEWQVLPIPLSRVVVQAAGNVFWFVERGRLHPTLAARVDGKVEIMHPSLLDAFLRERVAGQIVSANVRRTPYKFASIAAEVGRVEDDPIVARWRWSKHPREIDCARAGHFEDGKAVIRFMAWLQRGVRNTAITELDAARKLREFRRELPGYLGISMPFMSASGPNGSIAHYVPSDQSNRRLNDHPIYWMDSGGQYYGCSTDNTVCIALGTPESRHVEAHTLVVKGYLALARAIFPAGIPSTQIDALARQYLWTHGMDYGHATGHGVGNFMNIHEGPYIRKNPDHPMVAPLDPHMIVSVEPAYYREGDFGVRIEGHFVTVLSSHDGFLEFKPLSRLPIDPQLIDAKMLTAGEKMWLTEYHVSICAEYQGIFDEATTRWLHELTGAYLAMSAS